MSGEGSITRWIFDLGQGDDEAARHLWDRYFKPLMVVARKYLAGGSIRGEDEEDVALKALQSFISGQKQGEFGDLKDRGELWRLLAVIAKRKALNAVRHEHARTPKNGRIQSASVLSHVFSAGPTAEDLAEVLDELRHLMDVVLAGEEELRKVVSLKLDGLCTREIAERLGCTQRTVQRKLERVRILWEYDTERRFDCSDDRAGLTLPDTAVDNSGRFSGTE